MILSSALGSHGISSLAVLWEDGERILCRGWRDDGNAGRTSVLAVLSASEHPTPRLVNRLIHEHGLKEELDGRAAARPLALVREHGRTVVLLEDPGGEPLARLLGLPMEIGKFLRIGRACPIASRRSHPQGHQAD
jgi:hypothetical protein